MIGLTRLDWLIIGIFVAGITIVGAAALLS
jgi:hypothetical protein